MQTLASQFIKEDEENSSKGNLGIELFQETLKFYKGVRTNIGFEFEDKSFCYYDHFRDCWIEV
jgi:hypothetical protein